MSQLPFSGCQWCSQPHAVTALLFTARPTCCLQGKGVHLWCLCSLCAAPGARPVSTTLSSMKVRQATERLHPKTVPFDLSHEGEALCASRREGDPSRGVVLGPGWHRPCSQCPWSTSCSSRCQQAAVCCQIAVRGEFIAVNMLVPGTVSVRGGLGSPPWWQVVLEQWPH